jgi:hypothetical protein
MIVQDPQRARAPIRLTPTQEFVARWHDRLRGALNARNAAALRLLKAEQEVILARVELDTCKAVLSDLGREMEARS